MMRSLDFSDVNFIDRYWREKFSRDLSAYFIVEGWFQMKSGNKVAGPENSVERLDVRGDYVFDGDPAIYMGCGGWWCVEQNFIFSGMFACMLAAQSGIKTANDDEDELQFCKAFSWPLFKAAPVPRLIDALEQTALSPSAEEAANYLSMLDHVIPYIQSETAKFMSTRTEASTLAERLIDELKRDIQTLKILADQESSMDNLKA